MDAVHGELQAGGLVVYMLEDMARNVLHGVCMCSTNFGWRLSRSDSLLIIALYPMCGSL